MENYGNIGISACVEYSLIGRILLRNVSSIQYVIDLKIVYVGIKSMIILVSYKLKSPTSFFLFCVNSSFAEFTQKRKNEVPEKKK
jgi:hypothetical protein